MDAILVALKRRHNETGDRQDELALHNAARRGDQCLAVGLSPPGKVPPELDGYDWKEAFGYCGEPETQAGAPEENRPQWAGAEPKDEKALPVTRRDVKRILVLSEGENDGPEWLGIFDLWDGRYLYLEAGCDYTGWD